MDKTPSPVASVMPEAATHFDRLPDDATVSVRVFAAVAGEGISTVWRKARDRPDFPKPIRRGTKCTRFRVGAIRAYLSGKAA